jgi:hypothetical protein
VVRRGIREFIRWGGCSEQGINVHDGTGSAAEELERDVRAEAPEESDVNPEHPEHGAEALRA